MKSIIHSNIFMIIFMTYIYVNTCILIILHQVFSDLSSLANGMQPDSKEREGLIEQALNGFFDLLFGTICIN